MNRGSCLCGAVRLTVRGGLPAPDACHCRQCRAWSGHHWASSDVKRDALTIEGAEHLRWFRSSDKVRRGFCSLCGSSLLWDPVTGTDWTAVAMGAFEAPTGTHLAKHIFTGEKGDYYEIGDGLPEEAEPPC